VLDVSPDPFIERRRTHKFYDPDVFKFAHISQSLSALRGSVAVVWHDRLSVDVSY